MFGRFIFISIALFFLSYVSAQTAIKQFTADVLISQAPGMNPGSVVTAKISYDYLGTTTRFDYPNIKDAAGHSVVEIYNYTSGYEYQLCAQCSANQLGGTQPRFFVESNDVPAGSTPASITNDKGDTCNAQRKVNPANSGNVQYIWIVASTQQICQAQLVDGTTYTFSNFKAGAPTSSLFTIPASANCPVKPQCQTPMDLVLVLDQSGSIHRDEWQQLVAFSDVLVDSFLIGPNQTQIGVVFFSGVDYRPGQDPSVCCGLSDPALPLSFDKSAIKKILNSHIQTGGHTCINCGVNSATTYEPNPNRPIQVPKVMVVLTDGFNNRMTKFFAGDIARAQSLGWTMYAIGVNVSSPTQIQQIASPPIDQHVYFVDSFFDLKGIVGSISNSICQDFPNATSCGPLCKGKCSCGGQCICPDKCVPVNKCSTNNLVTQNGVCAGCISAPKFCDPTVTNGNKCVQNLCDPNTGNCVQQNVVCTPPDACFTATCDPEKGCIFTDRCPVSNSSCTIRQCSSDGKCNPIFQNCPQSNACSTSTCDPLLGCVTTPVNCDDGNRCTVDTCNPITGCVHTPLDCPGNYKNTQAYKDNPSLFNCLTITCDPKIGCVTTNKTCDDGNVCTLDSCDTTSGNCVHTVQTCPQQADKCSTVVCDPKVGCIRNQTVFCNDGNACTNDTCDPNTGKCAFTPVTCPASPNGCVTSVCDPAAQKCINKPNVLCPTQPGNKCLQSTCDPASKKCTSTIALACTPASPCSVATCDPTVGCVQSPKTCDDKNPCTSDSCDPTTGQCKNVPIPGCTCTNCNTNDPCNPVNCTNGQCVTNPVKCNIGNKCATFIPTVQNGACVCVPTQPVVCSQNLPPGTCGENVCDPATGTCKVQGGRVCDDHDPCTTDSCVVVGGKPTCQFQAIPCAGNSTCSIKKCVNKNGQAVCVDDTVNSVNCSSSNPCILGSCNAQTGKCQYTSVTCPSDYGNNATTCVRSQCNPVTGKCEQTKGLNCTATDALGCGIQGVCIYQAGNETCSYQPTCSAPPSVCVITDCLTSNKTNTPGTCTSKTVNCDDGNPCTVNDRCTYGVDQFGNPVAKCTYDTFNCTPSTDPCTVNKCVNQNGQPTCVPTNITCNPPDACTTGKCIAQNGLGVCQYTQKDCGASSICGTFVCDPKSGCTNQSSKCDDGNPCTDDFCDPKTGACSHAVKVCNSSNPCQTAYCDPNAGCITTPVNCSAQPNITALLDACHYAICSPVNGCAVAVVPNTLDACGLCNQPGACNATAGGVSPAAVAGAVIGGSVVAGAAAIGIGAFASSGSAAGAGAATQAPIVGANVNPLYAQPKTAGSNPFHGPHDHYVPLTN